MKNLKKYYPYIFPAIALLLVLFLAFRWYNLRTQRDQTPTNGQVEIENLTPEEQEEIVQGANDTTTVNLEGEATASGQVRYSVKDDRVVFSVSAALEKLTDGVYQVWVKPQDQEQHKAFELDYGKGGYTGSAALAADNMPFEVILSKELNSADNQMEMVILRGKVEQAE